MGMKKALIRTIWASRRQEEQQKVAPLDVLIAANSPGVKKNSLRASSSDPLRLFSSLQFPRLYALAQSPGPRS
jgi:hypothetical protein